MRGAATVDQIAVERLVCALAVIDVRDRTAHDRDYGLSVADIERDEAANGVIAPGVAVAFHTGWGLHCAEPASYLGSDDSAGVHFPGIGLKAAEWLVSRRGVCGIGIDTAGIDRGMDTAFEVHAEVTLPLDLWHLEGLVNLELIPARGATVFVGAVPLTGGSGAPARVIAVVFDSERKGPCGCPSGLSGDDLYPTRERRLATGRRGA